MASQMGQIRNEGLCSCAVWKGQCGQSERLLEQAKERFMVVNFWGRIGAEGAEKGCNCPKRDKANLSET